MAKVGRPKELYGPLVTVRLDALTHMKLTTLAKENGQSMSQTVREALAASPALESSPAGCPGGE